jgi:hypothetical protein
MDDADRRYFDGKFAEMADFKDRLSDVERDVSHIKEEQAKINAVGSFLVKLFAGLIAALGLIGTWLGLKPH